MTSKELLELFAKVAGQMEQLEHQHDQNDDVDRRDLTAFTRIFGEHRQDYALLVLHSDDTETVEDISIKFAANALFIALKHPEYVAYEAEEKAQDAYYEAHGTIAGFWDTEEVRDEV